MTTKVWMTTFAAGAVLAGLGTVALAQQVRLSNDPTYPVQIVSVSPRLSDDGALDGVKVTLRNVGTVPCEVFSVSLVLTFSNSQTARAAVRAGSDDLGYKNLKPKGIIAAGQDYTENSTIHIPPPSGGTITGIGAGIDYIAMADGKGYGPDPEKVARQVGMMRFARVGERKRLLNIYKTQGLQALLNDLERQ
ncbi:MAG: hypothetical protein ACRD2O_01680 [Terriglobia bacterium]